MKKHQDIAIHKRLDDELYHSSNSVSSALQAPLCVHRDTSKQIVKVLKTLWRNTPKPGAKPKLGIQDRVLLALEYWREYRTYFHIGSSWGVSESTVCCIVHWFEENLIRSRQFRLPGKKHLVSGFGRPPVVVLDVTETPIERPQRHQRRFYSGKKKRHTLKC